LFFPVFSLDFPNDSTNREREVMPASSALRKQSPRPAEKTKPRLFHARMVVTRVEEWCVEAETAAEAEALLTSGAGHRCTPGESIQVEFDRLLDE
jgi:hypothetical protein